MLRQKYFYVSFALHTLLLCALLFSMEFTSLKPVIENTSQNDVINVVILGDTEKSKILPKKEAPPIIAADKPAPPPPVIPIVKPSPPAPDVIALEAAKKKKILAALQKKQQAQLEKQLLADIEKTKLLQKKKQQAQQQAKFAKLLKEQSEKTMRQHFLDENIKLAAEQAKKTRGIVSKYQALIIQAISENWIVPPQTNRKLTCELMIKLGAGGKVLDVEVTKSSGDIALDRSARAAVLKASPLPVPSEPEAFEPFKNFALKVKPETLLAGQ